MKTFQHVIRDEEGIHARPAALLFQENGKYASEIVLHMENKRANAGNLMEVLSLGAECGQVVDVEISGVDEDAAYDGIKGFFEKYL